MGWLCIFRAFSHLNSHLKLLLAFQAYLSLPEGTASVAGLIAMMTDHYCNLVILVFIFYPVMFSFDCLTEPLLILVFINYLVMCSFDRFN